MKEYKKLLIIKHALQSYVKREGASELHLNQERKVLAEIEDRINRLRITPRKLTLGEYKGCGSCSYYDWCKNGKINKKKIKVRFIRNERADDWGRFVTVFSKGEEIVVEANTVGNTVLCAIAKSRLYPDYVDFISLENIEIVQ